MRRAKVVATLLVGAVALGSLVGPRSYLTQEEIAAAADRDVANLKALAVASAGSRRAKAIEDLRRTGTSESFDALKDLAASKDDHLALLAISALGRSGNSGASSAVERVLDDTSRSSVVRQMALAEWCARRKAGGARWSDISSTVSTKVGTNAALQSAATAIRDARFAGGSR